MYIIQALDSKVIFKIFASHYYGENLRILNTVRESSKELFFVVIYWLEKNHIDKLKQKYTATPETGPYPASEADKATVNRISKARTVFFG